MRAIGSILSNCTDIDHLNWILLSIEINFADLPIFKKIELPKIESLVHRIFPDNLTSFKAAWNGCVAFKKILSNSYMK